MEDKTGQAGKWLRSAESELETAKYLRQGHFSADSVFHSQQAAEKALKALQIMKTGRFDKVHDLLVLAEMVKAPDEITEICIALTPYYTIARYPDVEEHIEEETAMKMVEGSKKVVRWVKGMLNQ